MCSVSSAIWRPVVWNKTKMIHICRKLWARLCAKTWICIISFKPLYNPMRWGNRDQETLRLRWSKIVQLELGFKPRSHRLSNPCSPPSCCVLSHALCHFASHSVPQASLRALLDSEETEDGSHQVLGPRSQSVCQWSQDSNSSPSDQKTLSLTPHYFQAM